MVSMIDFCGMCFALDMVSGCDGLYECQKILKRFKPKGAGKKQYWIVIGDRDDYDNPKRFAKNAIKVDSAEEAQAKRKEILLACAEIAESEGL